ncbi:DUF3325 family protein [Pelomonas sp. KK5]|uniref:DUF3325 family protein n=1 Tax=Pelomonas sp. KK5 TaxID=1855730 RepID=UPI00097CBC5C|nr:DUF3325 family protein [Pelomonas sp. KK5]
MRPESLLMLAALLCCLAGAVWLAASLEAHWQQLRASAAPGRRQARALRALGAAAWIVALLLCCRADHASMAVLVWVMSVSAASCAVAFVFAWKPRVLAWLLAWA